MRARCGASSCGGGAMPDGQMPERDLASNGSPANGAIASPVLEIADLHAYYGASHVVQGISLTVGKSEAVGLMGRNGVGKTTTLKSIMGLEARARGTIR